MAKIFSSSSWACLQIRRKSHERPLLICGITNPKDHTIKWDLWMKILRGHPRKVCSTMLAPLISGEDQSTQKDSSRIQAGVVRLVVPAYRFMASWSSWESPWIFRLKGCRRWEPTFKSLFIWKWSSFTCGKYDWLWYGRVTLTPAVLKVYVLNLRPQRRFSL